MPYPASIIAYAFVKRGIAEGKFVTQMKLQKMVYFAHGYHLAKYNQPLIEEVFEAWKFGPVIQSLYSIYRSFGNNPINAFPSKKHDKELENLSESAKDAIDFTWNVTKDLTATTLSNWTHQQNSPWSAAYEPNSLSIPIGNDKIKTYFTELIAPNVHDQQHKH